MALRHMQDHVPIPVQAAGAIAVEVYDLTYAGFGKLVASVAPPLAIVE